MRYPKNLEELKARRCEECGNPTWECACVEDNLSEE